MILTTNCGINTTKGNTLDSSMTTNLDSYIDTSFNSSVATSLGGLHSLDHYIEENITGKKDFSSAPEETFDTHFLNKILNIRCTYSVTITENKFKIIHSEGTTPVTFKDTMKEVKDFLKDTCIVDNIKYVDRSDKDSGEIKSEKGHYYFNQEYPHEFSGIFKDNTMTYLIKSCERDNRELVYKIDYEREVRDLYIEKYCSNIFSKGLTRLFCKYKSSVWEPLYFKKFSFPIYACIYLVFLTRFLILPIDPLTVTLAFLIILHTFILFSIKNWVLLDIRTGNYKTDYHSRLDILNNRFLRDKNNIVDYIKKTEADIFEIDTLILELKDFDDDSIRDLRLVKGSLEGTLERALLFKYKVRTVQESIYHIIKDFDNLVEELYKSEDKIKVIKKLEGSVENYLGTSTNLDHACTSHRLSSKNRVLKVLEEVEYQLAYLRELRYSSVLPNIPSK